MRLIDADELRRRYMARGYQPTGEVWRLIDAAPTVDVPQPLTRDGVLAEVARIEAAGDTAVVEKQFTHDGDWEPTVADWVDGWSNPDEPRGNVRVRAVPVETETVPLTQLVGRTIKGETEAVTRIEWVTTAASADCRARWRWHPKDILHWLDFPDGTLDLATGMVTVLKGEA